MGSRGKPSEVMGSGAPTRPGGGAATGQKRRRAGQRALGRGPDDSGQATWSGTVDSTAAGAAGAAGVSGAARRGANDRPAARQANGMAGSR